jgi:hypothetical protein
MKDAYWGLVLRLLGVSVLSGGKTVTNAGDGVGSAGVEEGKVRTGIKDYPVTLTCCWFLWHRCKSRSRGGCVGYEYIWHRIS